jgi:hypothetical protein
MIALTTVVLTNSERKAIAAAARSIRIAFPDYDLIDRKDRKSRPDPDPLVLASMTTDHGPVTYQRFATAIAVLRQLREQVALEATPTHWEQFIARPPEGTTVTLPATAIPMSADPEQMAKVLVEARQLQLGEVEAALAICEQGLGLASPPPDPEQLDG